MSSGFELSLTAVNKFMDIPDHASNTLVSFFTNFMYFSTDLLHCLLLP